MLEQDVIDVFVYICVLFAVWCDIAHHFFWSKLVNNEQEPKSCIPLATELLVQSSQL